MKFNRFVLAVVLLVACGPAFAHGGAAPGMLVGRRFVPAATPAAMPVRFRASSTT